MDDNLVTIIEDKIAGLAEDVRDDIREHVRSKLEQALAEDTKENHWLVMLDAEGQDLDYIHQQKLARSEGFTEGVQRVARLLDIDIYEPYEPDV